MNSMAIKLPQRRRELLSSQGAMVDVVIDEPASGEGHAIVLLPSSLRDSLDYDDMSHRLALAGFRVLRPQPRGMGRSTPPTGTLTLDLLARDVVNTVNALGGGRAVLVGHAFGHFTARVADLNHPDSVRGVVVAGAAARVFPAGMPESLAIASDPAQPATLRTEHLQRAFFAPGNDPTPWLDGWYPQWRVLYRAAGAVPPKDKWWPVSHAPLLDLQGAQDPWRPPESRAELQQALGSERVAVHVIEGASHALLVEQPAAVAAAIVHWVQQLSD